MPTQPLLGYLARLGSFWSQSELLCTQALTYLLRTHEEARSALAGEVAEVTGLEIGNDLNWQAEVRQKDLARPDLEAHTEEEEPIVKIEAKLGAGLTPEEVQSYLADLHDRNPGEGALLVLVPKGRVGEATSITGPACELEGKGPWRVSNNRRIGIAVLSWDRLFDIFSSGQCQQFRYDLEQLQEMYRVLSGDYIAPLASVEELREWKEREDDLVEVVDKVTRRLTTQHRLYPIGDEWLAGTSHDGQPNKYRRRYVCSSGDRTSSCYSIGVRDSFAEWVTPIWMRFHQGTGDFPMMRLRVEASSLRWLDSEGHIWIPLDVPVGVSGEGMVQALIDQVEAVLRVAHGTD